MIIFLYGQDTYRIKQKLGEIIGQYQKIHQKGLNLKYLEPKGFQEFYDELSQRSMFEGKKLLVLFNPFEDNLFKEKFLKNIKKISDSSDIVIVRQGDERRIKDLNLALLKKFSKFQEFKPLGQTELKRWVLNEFKKRNFKISDYALNFLINFVGSDLWRMENEIKKLINYKAKEQEIDQIDVKRLVKPKIENAIFKTIDSISRKDKKSAIKLIQAHLKKGDSPLYLFSMIVRQFRNLLLLKSDPKFSKELHPYEAKKLFYQLPKFSLEELKRIYQKIFEFDLKIKTGKIPAEKALNLLITEI